VTREKGVYKNTRGTRKCNCKTKMATRQIAPGMYQQYPTQTCEDCPAVKLVRTTETLRVEVEPGMRDGAEITFFEQGEPVIDGEPGDLKFRLVTVPMSAAAAAAAARAPGGAGAGGGGAGGGAGGGGSVPAFERRGDDLHVSATVTLTDALVGFERSLTHLDGRAVALTAAGVTRPGDVVRLKGQGMPTPSNGRKFGDMVVTYAVQMPAALSEEQKEVVRELFKHAF
jgi:DnaJ family protein B protein 11